MTKEIRTHKSHDGFFKKSMGRIHIATEFFETYLPQDVLSEIDLSTLKKEETSYLSNILREGIVDLLYGVKFREGKGYLSILLEHQSQVDKNITFRIQKYMHRIFEEHKRKHPGSKLPIIYPIILYTGRGKYNAPRSFYELFERPELAKKFLTRDIKVIEVSEIEDKELREKYYSGVMLCLMHRIYERDIAVYREDSTDIGKDSEKRFSIYRGYGILCNRKSRKRERRETVISI